jgi:hypothetical protein
MKIIGCLLIIGIFLSYAPVFHMDECPEGNHMGNMKMDCGVPFHFPMIMDTVVSGISGLPLDGLFIATKMLPLDDGVVNPIFHPPEYSTPNLVPWG